MGKQYGAFARKLNSVSSFTENEREAIDRKQMNPSDDVVCPRCGKLLLYNQGKWQDEVKCQRNSCLRGTLKGI